MRYRRVGISGPRPRNLICRLGVSVCVEGPRFKLLHEDGGGLRQSLADFQWPDVPELLSLLGEAVGDVLEAVGEVLLEGL